MARPPSSAVELQLDRAAVAVERGAGDREQQVEHVGMHLVAAAQEDAARLVEHLQRVAGAHEQAQPVVEVVGVAGGARVQDDEVGDEPLVPPVLVGEQRLAHERRVLELLDAHEQDRQVARDADRPQPRHLQPVLDRRLHLERRVRVGQQQARSQPLERDGLLRADAEVAQLELRRGPREVDGALSAADVVVLLGEAHRLLAVVRDAGREDDAHGLLRRDLDLAADRAAGVEHRLRCPRRAGPAASSAAGSSTAAQPAEERGAVGLVRPVAWRRARRRPGGSPRRAPPRRCADGGEQHGVRRRRAPRSRRRGSRTTCAPGRRPARSARSRSRR